MGRFWKNFINQLTGQVEFEIFMENDFKKYFYFFLVKEVKLEFILLWCLVSIMKLWVPYFM
jgi:hypothetical protein